jgi:hypothetical protein
MDTQCLDLDLHRSDLRFAGARIAEPRAVEHIARWRLGRDTARVEWWARDLAAAVVGVLARTQSRAFAAIEEAAAGPRTCARPATMAARGHRAPGAEDADGGSVCRRP